ncbi:hypothetical protein C8T65DRAFT_692852 [Cerioporus squamosus]|nr:hypothetical protein C8T65DRAFT_692852 [Cerioporus squamosus]
MSRPPLCRTKTDESRVIWPNGGETVAESIAYAWWAGYGEERRRGDEPERMEHVYVSRLRPTTPLEVGMRVALVAMANRKKAVERETLGYYEPYDPHIIGEVEGIRRLTRTWVRVTIRNDCRGNTVGRVNLDVPHVPGVTIRRRCGLARTADLAENVPSDQPTCQNVQEDKVALRR